MSRAERVNSAALEGMQGRKQMTATSKTTKNNPPFKFQKILEKEGEGWIGKEGRERERKMGMREREQRWMDR